MGAVPDDRRTPSRDRMCMARCPSNPLLQSVQSNAGAGNTLLLAVGVALIGGTSLFGGHGRIIDAVLGGLVVAVIINRMSDLIQGANSAGYEWVVTGAVLLLAAGFDAVVRRGRCGGAAR